MSENEHHLIWNSDDCEQWQSLLDRYGYVIEAQGNERLVKLDAWYREELPLVIASRPWPYIILQELQDVVSWKMTRGVWRERNRQLLRQNSPDEIKQVSRAAFAASPDPGKPISLLSGLMGVGPATASAVMAAYKPEIYPFFEDVVAAQIPGLGPVAFTTKYYANYAAALRERADALTEMCAREWTAHDLGQALWAASGGKAAV